MPSDLSPRRATAQLAQPIRMGPFTTPCGGKATTSEATGYELAGDFLLDLFGEAETVLGLAGIWTCGFANFPGNWQGGWGLDRFWALSPDEANFYFCIGALRPDTTRRSNEAVEAHVMIVADDVGTKAGRERWDGMFALGFPEPSARIETSPGNETWIWVLDRPVWANGMDPVGDRAVRLVRAWMGERGLGDVGALDAARYIRLPIGWNSKPKYMEAGVGAESGVPPKVRLLEWVPGRRASLDEMGRALLGANWSAGADFPAAALPATTQIAGSGGSLVRCADVRQPEPLMQLWEALGHPLTQVRTGVVEADCPNIAAHTQDGREGTGFAFLGNGLMECQHASCQHLRTADFRALMCEAYDNMAAGALAIVGVPPAGGADAGEFLARRAFERSPLAEHDDAVVARLASKEAAAALDTKTRLSATTLTPARIGSAAALPPRQFLYGKHVHLGTVSMLSAPGGSGKSALTMAEALAMASGRVLVGGHAPRRPLRVWVHNAEDPADELARRLAAAALHHGVDDAALDDRLILTSGRDLDLTLAREGARGAEAVPGIVDALVDLLTSQQIDVLILDPLGAMHTLNENDNSAVNVLMGILRRIADWAGVAVLLVHHTGKIPAKDMRAAGVAASRGASAFTDAARHARQLVPMTEKEANTLRVAAGDRWRYMQVANGKSNLAPRGTEPWVRLVGVKLNNGAGLWPEGDTVQTVEDWHPPAAPVASASDFARVAAAMAADPNRTRTSQTSPGWLGYLVADTLGLDIGPHGTRNARTPEQAAARDHVQGTIRTWAGEGKLRVCERKDRKSERRDYYTVDPAADLAAGVEGLAGPALAEGGD